RRKRRPMATSRLGGGGRRHPLVALGSMAAILLLVQLALAAGSLTCSAALDARRIPLGQSTRASVRLANPGPTDIRPVAITWTRDWTAKAIPGPVVRAGSVIEHEVDLRPDRPGVFVVRVNAIVDGRRVASAEAGVLEVVEPSSWLGPVVPIGASVIALL